MRDESTDVSASGASHPSRPATHLAFEAHEGIAPVAVTGEFQAAQPFRRKLGMRYRHVRQDRGKGNDVLSPFPVRPLAGQMVFELLIFVELVWCHYAE